MDIRSKIQAIYSLEQLSGGDTCIHRLHPLTKLITTFVFIVITVSFGSYEFGRLVPLIFYPTVVMALSGIPYAMLIKRFALALPFCLLAGLSNIIFDAHPAFTLGNLAVSYGVVSLFVIFLKAYLCVMAVLLLISTTRMSALTNQMRRLKVPSIFVTLLEMTYRYVGTLADETASMYTAYILRSGGKKGLEMRHMGSFVGQLLMRSFDRAERVYAAMKCRGYALQENHLKSLPFNGRDWSYAVLLSCAFILLRLLHMPALYNHMIKGILS